MLDWFLIGKISVTFLFLAMSFVGTARDAVRLAPAKNEEDRARLRIAARSSFMIIVFAATVIATIAVIALHGQVDWKLLACVVVFHIGVSLFVLARIFTISDYGEDSTGIVDWLAFTVGKWSGVDVALCFVVGRMITKAGAAVWAFYLLADFLMPMNLS